MSYASGVRPGVLRPYSVPGCVLTCSEFSAVREIFRETVLLQLRSSLGTIQLCPTPAFTRKEASAHRARRCCFSSKAAIPGVLVPVAETSAFTRREASGSVASSPPLRSKRSSAPRAALLPVGEGAPAIPVAARSEAHAQRRGTRRRTTARPIRRDVSGHRSRSATRSRPAPRRRPQAHRSAR